MKIIKKISISIMVVIFIFICIMNTIYAANICHMHNCKEVHCSICDMIHNAMCIMKIISLINIFIILKVILKLISKKCGNYQIKIGKPLLELQVQFNE